MAIIDPSYVDLAKLILRPLTAEFEYPWNIIRSVFWGLLPVAVLACITGMALDPTPEYIKAKVIFGDLSLCAGVLVLLTYGACCWQAYKLHQIEEASKTTRIKKFHD